MKKLIVAIVAAISLIGSASAQTVTVEKAKQRSWVNCAIGVGAGAVLGGVVGSQAAKALKMNRTVGTVIGAGLGGWAGCAIADKLTAKDKVNLTANEVAAASSKSGYAEQSIKANGETVLVKSTATPITIQGSPSAKCKSVSTTMTGKKTGSAESTQVYCKNKSGEYEEAGNVL